MKVRKEKGILYFTKDTGDIATVSMIDGSMMEYKTHKKKWENRKSLTMFFSGESIKNMSTWETEDEILADLLLYIKDQHEYAQNIGTFLKEARQYNEIEKLLRMGFKIEKNVRISEKLDCPKDILNIVKGINISTNRQISSINDIDNHKYFRLAPKDKRFIQMITLNLDGWSDSFSKTMSFMQKRKLNMKNSIEYIYYLYMYEGLNIWNIYSYYYDYVNMREFMGRVPEKYPKFLKSKHDITYQQYYLYKKEFSEDKFIHAYDGYDLTYKDNQYCIIQPQQTKDLKDEGINLHHCVESYIDRVIDGECLIYFMRKDEDTSFITVEIRDNAIVQVKGINNRLPLEHEKEWLCKWAKIKGLNSGYIGC